MANTYKNIIITPNRDTDAANVPFIRFSGGDGTSNTDINVRVYTAQNGTLSFEGSAGQLFSVTNDLTGTIFSVNDVSGIPSLEIDAAGLVKLTEFGGNVAVGRANANYKVDVVGGVNASAFFINGQPTNIQGIQGLQGRQGTQGFQGIQGTTGSQGFQGIQGTTGSQGFQGTTGSQGFQGIQGTLGLQGFQGIQGTLGLQGFQGIQGTTGSQGIQGLRGASDWTPNFSGGVTQSSSDSSTFTKTSGTNGAWDGQVYSTQGYVRGAYATARAPQTNAPIMFGLNSDPSTDGSYLSMDYAIYFLTDATIQIYESGSLISSHGAYTASSVLTITYDGVNVRYYRDGTLLRTVARSIGNPLYFDSSYYNTGTSLSSVGFGPMGESVQGIQGTLGLQGFQGIQGTTGSTGGTGGTGLQGFQGIQGTTGSTGGTGGTGLQGFQGIQGRQGIQGTDGLQGRQGIQGTTGGTGGTGLQGFQGIQGTLGLQGFQGTTGTQGFQGIQGTTGSTGGTGGTGLQGFQGIQGTTGSTGGTGGTGLQGFQGIQGRQGIQGTLGLQGFQGIQGTSVQGTTGTSVSSANGRSILISMIFGR